MTLWQRLNWLWRLCATALAYSFFSVFGLLLSLLIAPVLQVLPGDEQQRQRRGRHIVHLLFWVFINFMRILGILYWETECLHRLQRNSGLVLANHPTLLDVVFLIAFIPNANCVVKSRLWHNPAMRYFLLITGYIANDTGHQLIELSRAALKEGCMLIVFPEGTRTRNGQVDVLKLQRGAANIAVRCQQNITPVVIDCQPPTLSKEHKWYHIPSRKFVMSFRVGEEIAITDFTDDSTSLGVRRLNSYLTHYFTKENRLNASRKSQTATQNTYYRNAGIGRH